MDKRITSAQIVNWFTIGTQFADITVSDGEANIIPGDRSTEQCSEQTSSEVRLNEHPWRNERRERLSGTGSLVGLASYEYPKLPITKNRQELVSLIENNSIVIVRGATGSGKTTQLPQFVLDHYTENNKPCNIVVTQPRKIGASSIARWVARERKCPLGALVGYQVGLEKMATENTKLIYVTTGVLLQKLVGAKTLTEYTHIFIDEIHERTNDLDFLLLVVKKLLRTNSRYVKVILMSATINCKEFADYFGTLIRNQMNSAYVFEVEGAPYTIEEFYLDDLKNILPPRVHPSLLLPEEPCITEEMFNVAVSLIQSLDEMEAKQRNQEETGGVSLERGSVLVFLPGLAEIQYMKEALLKLVRHRLQVYPLHSTVTLDEQNDVFLVPVPGCRKVILSTNIAESSVTVPDVKYVIDFCLVRQLMCDKETNYRFLCLNWASKNSCNQRRGRAGRVSKGYCYRLVTRSFWDQVIPNSTVPEMLRSPLASVLLKVKILDMGDPRSVLSTALSPPKLNDIEATILQLKQIGALTVQRSSQRHFDGDLTFLGRVLAHLPVDLQLGKLIILGHVFGCLEECLILAASLSLKSFFAMPSVQQIAGYRSKLSFAQNVPSDFIAFVNAFRAWYTARANGELRHPKDEFEWGKQNFIQIKRIREVAELFEELKKRVSKFNMHVSSSCPTDSTKLQNQRFILQVVIAGAFFPNYFSVREIDDQLANKDLCGHDQKTTVLIRSLPPYSFLYYKQILSTFRQCGQIKSISFDESRAYVVFNRSGGKETGVLPEVLLALLRARHGPTLSLQVHHIDEIESYARGDSITHLRHLSVDVDVESQTVRPVGVLDHTIDPKKLPAKKDFIVNITEVVNVGHFWGFLADESNVEMLAQLALMLNSTDLSPVSAAVHPNLLCVAPFTDPHKVTSYYRAKILCVLGSNVEVFFVDYGNTAIVPCRSLRELPPDLLTQPHQAQEFCIAGIRPSAESIIHGDPWSSRARNRFITLTRCQSMMVTLYSINHGVMRVDLHVSMEGGVVSMADLLVKEGHACRTAESFASRQNHEILMSVLDDVASGRYMPCSVGGTIMRKMEEDRTMINNLIQHFSSSHSSAPKCKAIIRGPISPHKINFHNMNRGQYREVVVEQPSVNSVMVNESPQDLHERILVAASVSLCSSGSRVLLRETSLMPYIYGFPSLVSMLFSPIMELRTNEDKTSFTGAICGLGWDSISQEAMMPEHDIELTFDVKINIEDIIEINSVRRTINKLLCEGPNGLLNLNPNQISAVQEEAQERLVRLFTKTPPRPDCAPEYFTRIKKWNQIDPSQQMELQERDEEKSPGILFTLHPIPILDI